MQHGDTSQTGWRSRLRTWWNGDPLASEAPETAQEAAVPAPPGEPEPNPIDDIPTVAAWPARRQRVAQHLFGEGMHLPGGEEWARTLTSPLGLNSNHSVTELGCGLGGLSCMLGRDKIWLDAYEGDATLARAAEAQVRHQGVRQHVTVRHADLDAIDLKKRSQDVILSREGLFTVQDKPHLLMKMRAALKTNGQLMFTDFLRTGSENNRIYQVWREREPVVPQLMTPDSLQAELEGLQFNILYIEDVTDAYKIATLHAFHAYDREIKAKGAAIDPIEREWVINEGEHWAIRISAMDAQAIRLFRVFCRVP